MEAEEPPLKLGKLCLFPVELSRSENKKGAAPVWPRLTHFRLKVGGEKGGHDRKGGEKKTGQKKKHCVLGVRG